MQGQTCPCDETECRDSEVELQRVPLRSVPISVRRPRVSSQRIRGDEEGRNEDSSHYLYVWAGDTLRS